MKEMKIKGVVWIFLILCFGCERNEELIPFKEKDLKSYAQVKKYLENHATRNAITGNLKDSRNLLLFNGDGFKNSIE